LFPFFLGDLFTLRMIDVNDFVWVYFLVERVEVCSDLILLLQNESALLVQLRSKMHELLLSELNLVPDRVDSKETNSLLDQINNVHERELHSFVEKLLGNVELIENVLLLFHVVLSVFCFVLLVKF